MNNPFCKRASSFPLPWKAEKVGKRKYRLLDDFQYVGPGGEIVVVPKGFVTDGNSIPFLLQIFAHDRMRGLFGGTIHDWLYGHGKNRAWADRVYRLALGDEGDLWGVVIWLRWLGVRVGGAWAWRRGHQSAARQEPEA